MSRVALTSIKCGNPAGAPSQGQDRPPGLAYLICRVGTITPLHLLGMCKFTRAGLSGTRWCSVQPLPQLCRQEGALPTSQGRVGEPGAAWAPGCPTSPTPGCSVATGHGQERPGQRGSEPVPEEPPSPGAASPAAKRAGVTWSSSTGRINLHNKFLCKQMSDLFFLL